MKLGVVRELDVNVITPYSIFASQTRLGEYVGITVENEINKTIGTLISNNEDARKEIIQGEQLCLVYGGEDITIDGVLVPSMWISHYIDTLTDKMWIRKDSSLYVDLSYSDDYDIVYGEVCKIFYNQIGKHFPRSTPFYKKGLTPYRELEGFWTSPNVENVVKDYGSVFYIQ